MIPEIAAPVVDMAHRKPCARLQPYIALYAGCRIESPLTTPTRALPSRYVTLMIGWRSKFRIAEAGAFRSFVGGLRDTPAMVAPARVEGVHVFVRPLATRALLGVPSGTLAGDVLHLRDIAGSRVEEMQDRLGSAKSWTERFAILDHMFCAMLTEPRPPGEFDWAWQTILKEAGATRMERLAKEIGWSRRHFSKRFHDEFGVGPKTIARIARFEKACAMIKRRRVALIDVAWDAGYHDQSHMTREWQSLAGCSPRVWIAEELPFVQDYELAGME